MTKSYVRKFLLGSLPFVIMLLVWQTLTYYEWVKPYFLPSPSDTFLALYNQLRSGSLWLDLKDSATRILIGYLLALAGGIPIGILLGTLPTFRVVLQPFNNFVRYTPLPAFIPLIVMWVGIGTANPVTLVFLSVFWSLIVLVGDTVSNVPSQYSEMARTLGLSRAHCLFRVILPAAWPGIFDALRISAGLAWSSVILAEISGPTTGLGHVLMEAQRFLRSEIVIGGIIFVGILGILTDFAFAVAYQVLFPWTERARQAHKDSAYQYAS